MPNHLEKGADEVVRECLSTNLCTFNEGRWKIVSKIDVVFIAEGRKEELIAEDQRWEACRRYVRVPVVISLIRLSALPF